MSEKAQAGIDEHMHISHSLCRACIRLVSLRLDQDVFYHGHRTAIGYSH